MEGEGLRGSGCCLPGRPQGAGIVEQTPQCKHSRRGDGQGEHPTWIVGVGCTGRGSTGRETLGMEGPAEGASSVPPALVANPGGCRPRSLAPRPGPCSHPVIAPGPLIRSPGDASPPQSAPDNSSSSRCFSPHTPGNCLPANSNKYLFPQGGMGGKGRSRPHAPGQGERGHRNGHNTWLEKFPALREVR